MSAASFLDIDRAVRWQSDICEGVVPRETRHKREEYRSDRQPPRPGAELELTDQQREADESHSRMENLIRHIELPVTLAGRVGVYCVRHGYMSATTLMDMLISSMALWDAAQVTAQNVDVEGLAKIVSMRRP